MFNKKGKKYFSALIYNAETKDLEGAIHFQAPNKKAAERIANSMCKKINIVPDCDLYVGKVWEKIKM